MGLKLVIENKEIIAYILIAYPRSYLKREYQP